MRQVFFLLASAMFVAFSLSWASPSNSIESYYAVPDQVLLPNVMTQKQSPEVSATITLKDTCESIDRVDQEQRGNKVIFSIRLQHRNDDLCLRKSRSNVAVSAALREIKPDHSRRIDIYFREDDENLRYFGAIEMKEELLSQN